MQYINISLVDLALIFTIPPAVMIILSLFFIAASMRFDNRFRDDLVSYLKRTGKSINFINGAIALFGDNGIQALSCFRLSNWFYKKGINFTADILRKIGIFVTGIDIAPSAEIGGGLEIFHGTGIVIGREVVIGRNNWIFQGVSIGYSGSGCPRIGDNVKMFAGAVLAGDIEVGSNSMIGANVVLTISVPDDSKVVAPSPVVTRGTVRK